MIIFEIIFDSLFGILILAIECGVVYAYNVTAEIPLNMLQTMLVLFVCAAIDIIVVAVVAEKWNKFLLFQKREEPEIKT